MYCSSNAASQSGRFIVGLNNFYTLYNGIRINLPELFPTNEQAEILIKDKNPIY